MSDFNKANQAVHPVETQWHYKMLTDAGFVPETKEGIGFVRSYTYHHSDGRTITTTTGSSCDYWSSNFGEGGRGGPRHYLESL